MTNRDSFVFFKSIFEAIEKIPNKAVRGEAYKTIAIYGLTGKEPTQDSNVYIQLVFTQAKPIIDNSIKRYDNCVANGKKGGRPKENKNQDQNQDINQSNNQDNNQNHNLNKNKNVNKNKNENINKESKKVSKNINTRAYACESYDAIFEEFEISSELKLAFIEFIKHCQINNRILTNEKLKGIIVRLDMAFNNEADKIQCLKKAINKGYFDIAER